ncbi:ABC transporter transmembrane region, partial [Streptomyces sp. Ncost-T6T-2b]
GSGSSKGFGQEDQETGKLREVGRRLFAGRLRTIRLNSRYTPALQAVPALGQVAMLALGGWLATRGEITLGTFVAFSTYLAQLVGPVRMLAMVLDRGAAGPCRCRTRPGAHRHRALHDGRAQGTARRRPGRDRVRRRHLRIRGRPARPRRVLAHRRTGRDRRRRRRLRQRQVHRLAPAAPLLRCLPRRRPHRRPRRPRADPGLPARRHRARPRGQLPLLRHRPRQHRLRPPRRHPGADRDGRPRRPGPRVHLRTAERLRHHRRRARAHPLRRPAPARRPRPRHPPPTPGSSSSTTRPPPSTPASSTRSTRR